MRILFIIPPLKKEMLYGEWDLSKLDSVSPPIGLLSVAAVVRDAGHEVHIVDGYANSHSFDTIYKNVVSFNPDVIGISCVTQTFSSTVSLVAKLKSFFPDKIFILGGAHITALPEDAMKMAPHFDYGVIAEGEVTIVDLLDAIQKKGNLEEVDGIIYRRNGELRQTASRKFIDNLDVLPFPAWDILPSLTDPYRLSIVGTTENKSTALLTSRGCPCRCNFCDVGGVGKKIRYFSADYVARMIEYLKDQYDIRDFVFYDDAFTTLKKRTYEICDKIIEQKLNVSWSCCARADCVDLEMLKAMRRAGCWQIEYGIESGSQRVIDHMQKRIKLEQIRKALKWTKEAGIVTRGNFIFGYLIDTRETLQESINFALSIDLDYFQQTYLTPYPGSAIYQIADQYGSFNKDLDKMNNIAINFVPNGMTEQELRSFSKKAFRRFYFRPKIIYFNLKRVSSLKDVARQKNAFYGFLKTITQKTSKKLLNRVADENTTN